MLVWPIELLYCNPNTKNPANFFFKVPIDTSFWSDPNTKWEKIMACVVFFPTASDKLKKSFYGLETLHHFKTVSVIRILLKTFK